jgi:hypothetical protein
MATPPRPSATSDQVVRGPLLESLATLAGTPDDASGIDAQLVTIAALAADMVEPVSYASVTAVRGDAYTTVATSSQVALAVDEAQYADRTGTCLDALETATPVSVPAIETTMAWPGFRQAAFGLGLRASLSLPLFAGSGTPIAALNLYSHDADAMGPLTRRVWSIYDPQRPHHADRVDWKPGEAELLAGLAEAFAVRDLIQQAIGVVMAREHRPADEAYLVLRGSAAASGVTLIDIATTLTAPTA